MPSASALHITKANGSAKLPELLAFIDEINGRTRSLGPPSLTGVSGPCFES